MNKYNAGLYSYLKKSLPTTEAVTGRTEGSWDLRTHN